MSELVAFLEARLADDEAVARGRLRLRPEFRGGRVEGSGLNPDTLTIDGKEVPFDDAMEPAPPDARVLREVTAKRAILAKYQRAQAAYQQMVNPASTAAVFALTEVVQHMAAIHSDHPDFQEQWR